MTQCTAKNRQGEQCKHAAINGTSKCRFHGGASLIGIASPTFKTGRYSKHLPTRLAAKYAEALADPDLLALRDEIALIHTRQTELLEHLDTGLALRRWKDAQAAYGEARAAIAGKDSVGFQVAMVALGDALNAGMGDYAIWQEIVEMTEQRRRLVESEHKRLVNMQQMISTERAMALLAVITDTIRRHVSDPSALAAIAAELRQFTVIDAGE
jgi:hypothetical protein